MREEEWVRSTDPQSMLEFLQANPDRRKARLFVCAGCRTIWSLLPDERSRKAIGIAEEYADGAIGEDLRKQAFYEALQAALPLAAWTASSAAAGCAVFAVGDLAGEIGVLITSSSDPCNPIPPKVRCDLLREIFGNPFRPAIVEAAWLSWQAGSVTKLARAIYEQRLFQDMPVLADALEEAGCGEEIILSHCRSDALHVRGCWVLDALMDQKTVGPV
jgi:hypothetical protein